MTIVLEPITLREAHAFVAEHHRHHDPAQGALFALAASAPGGDDGKRIVVGVSVVARPVAQALQNGEGGDYIAEVRRLCVLPDRKNACSFLYGASWRAARALGYRRLITYTLPEEGGASLRAAGWTLIGEAGGGAWGRAERPRVDTHPTQVKLRWERVTS